MNTATANFSTTMGQTTETSQQKKTEMSQRNTKSSRFHFHGNRSRMSASKYVQ